MRGLFLLTAMFAVMCVATSHATQVALSGNDPVKNKVIADFLTANFYNVTVIQGDYSNPANIPAGTDVFMVARFLYSGNYSNAANSATFNALTIPVVCLTSFVARPDANRWGWHTGAASAGSSIVGNETTVTAAGAAIFGASGTVDWWTVTNGASSFNAAGTGTVGDGEILATIDGKILVASWKAGDLTGMGATLGSNRLLFNIPDTDGNGAPGLPNTVAGRQALVDALEAVIGLTAYSTRAWSPNPTNSAAVDLASVTQLSWSDPTDPNIVSIDGYDVVFGTEPNMLLNTTYVGASNPFVLADNSIALDYETTYYWRVDSHVTLDSNDIVAVGNPWYFTTLPDDKVPVVTVDADNKNMLTFLGAGGLPAALTGSVNDWTDGDIASVQWEVLNFPAVNTAMQMILRDLSNPTIVDNLAQITSDPYLYVDWIGTDTRELGDPMELRMKGLPAGTYNWTSFHADPENQHGSFNVTVVDADYDSNNLNETTTVQISDNNSLPISTYTATITADGTNDVVLVFDQTPWGGTANLAFFVMNGFELTKGVGALKIDFGRVNGLHSTTAGYQFYEADHENAATFTEQSYSAFGTTVSIQPKWGSIAATGAVIADTTHNPASASQSASFDTNVAAVYTIQLSATDNKPQTGSDTMTVTVAEDACAAAQLAPDWVEFDDSDADGDCDVDLADLAAYAAQWLDDRNLTGQVQL